jgi:site-specific DNA-cytosine methylase
MQHKGYEVISVDIDTKTNPTHLTDILDFDYKQYPSNHFDVVWASPLCTEYSIIKANFGLPRNLDFADSLVLRTLEIIHYFNPTAWFIENPQTGLLKNRPFMVDLPFIDCDYCQFGFDYRKRTRFWNNLTGLSSVLCNPKVCPKVVNRKHIEGILNHQNDGIRKTRTLNDRYRIPEPLLEYLFQSL